MIELVVVAAVFGIVFIGVWWAGEIGIPRFLRGRRRLRGRDDE